MKLQTLFDGRTDLVFDYVDTDYGPRLTDEQGFPLIRWCAYYGDVSAIRFLLSRGARLEDLGENYDLNGAVFHGHWQLCQFLLEQGADPNFLLAETGETPLHSCFCKANAPVSNMILKLLLHHGADPQVMTLPGKESGSFLRDVNTRGETPLHRAAAFGDATAIQLLLDAGADKEARDKHGESPLSWASWHLRPASILSLLSFGPHRIHPLHVERMKSDHGFGWGGGIMMAGLGELHLES